MADTEKISLLVTVKAYPAISQKHGESVCVAGIRTDTAEPEWARLFPIPFRDLDFSVRFKKYQTISIAAERSAGSDTRPESWKPNIDSLEVGASFDSRRNWALRKPYVMPLVAESMCELQRRQKVDGTSLGVFQPANLQDFTVEAETDRWDATKQGVVAQPSLLNPTKRALEKVPFRFRYRYRCASKGCRSHAQSIIDWELDESYRSWRTRYGPEELLDKLREKWLDTMWGTDRDSYLFVGNQHRYPEAFLVLGVFWPKKED